MSVVKLQLSDQHLALIRQILHRHLDVRQHQPIIFGSQASGTARQYSDVDLGFIGTLPLDKQAYIRIVDDLEESTLPYKVDVVDFATAEASFRDHALRHYQKI